jgi:hypothetical protein
MRTVLIPLMLTVACTSGDSTTATLDTDGASAGTFSADAWADNWFAMYEGDTLVVEDSVSITTERSFNAESFTFDATPPFALSFVLKDFKENDSGLEYIGEGNQQMGDGGFIFQLKDSAGDLVLVSDADWRCLTTHFAPVDKTCEGSANPLSDCTWETTDEPSGWKDDSFDDSEWAAASTWTAADVGPKDGYDEISWASAAQLIWGEDLEQVNTLLCRAWVR